MRAIAMLAVLHAGPVAADPAPPKPQPGLKLPEIVKEALEGTQALVTPNGVLGMDGNIAAGIVVKPPYHRDAEPVHKGGSWIVPPDPNDPMAIELGTNQLRSRERVEAWLPRDLSRSIKRGADKVWEVVLPKL